MLTGDLGEFAVRDVLGLVARAGATGALVLHDAGDARIHCAGGAVTFAATRPDVSLADVLVATRFIQAEQWAEAARADDPATAVARALAANGADPVRLAGVLQGRTEEAVFELDLWRAGRFTFEPGADHLLGDAFRFAIDDVLRAVEDRRRRWDAIVGRFGSLDHVVAPEAIGDLGDVGDDEVVLSRTQFRVLAAAARHVSVAALARLLDLGIFATGELVAGLLDHGLLVVLDPASTPPPMPAPLPVRVPVLEAPVAELPVLELVGAGHVGGYANGHANGDTGGHANGDTGRAPVAPGGAEFVAPGDAPARDLILRLLTAVKEL